MSDVRDNIIIATKTQAKDKETLFKHLETSLRSMKTDYIDIFQLHNPPELPDSEDPNSLYSGLIEARQKGMIRFIGITNYRLKVTLEAINSELYDTIQFPLSSLSSEAELKLIEESRKKDIGVIAMKALSGGLITNVSSTFAFLRQFDNVVPIWGIQKESELDEFIELKKTSLSWMIICGRSFNKIGRNLRELFAVGADTVSPARQRFLFQWQPECLFYLEDLHIKVFCPTSGRHK